MSIRMSVLGSGSGGNSTLVLLDEGTHVRRLLIDAGLSPRDTARRLEQFGLTIHDIDEVLLTHLDTDHFRQTWARAAVRHDITFRTHRRHYRRTPAQTLMRNHLVPFDDAFELDAQTTVYPVQFAHDQLGTVGFVIEHAGVRLGFATDLGCVPESLFAHFRDLDVLAIESNYDRQMQISSPRPAFLKARIMGGLGHLSNEQSIDAVARVAQQSRLRHVVLLHLSRQCNCPTIIDRLYSEHTPELKSRLTVSNQFEPTPLLHSLSGTPALEVKVFAPIRNNLRQPTLF